MRVTKPIDLVLLERELGAAGVPTDGLGYVPTDDAGSGEVYTYDPSGEQVDLPPEAQPVVDAHVAPPPVYEYARTVPVEAVVRTTTDAPTEVWRLTSATKHQYAATFVFMATDEATAACKRTDIVYVWKRDTAAPTLVGEAPISNVDEQGSAGWDVAADFDGDGLVVRVVGGRTSTVDWLVRGRVELFAPGGLGS